MSHWADRAVADLRGCVILDIDGVKDPGGCNYQNLIAFFRMNGDYLMGTV